MGYALTPRSMVRVCGAAFALTMLLGLPAADARRRTLDGAQAVDLRQHAGVTLNEASPWVQYVHQPTGEGDQQVFYIRDNDYWTRRETAPSVGVSLKFADGNIWRESKKSAAAGEPGAPRKRQRRLAPASLNCTTRVGCNACVADELCLWCVSPRRCLDAGHPIEKLYESCPIQQPVPVCVDMNLARERQGFIRPCSRSIGGSLGREDMPMPDACCGDGVCDTVQAEQAATWTNLEWSAEQAIALSEDEQNCPADCLRNEGAVDAEAAKSRNKMSIPKKLIDTLDSTTTVFGTLQEIVHDTYHCEDSYDQDNDGDVTSACSPKSQAQ